MVATLKVLAKMQMCRPSQARVQASMKVALYTGALCIVQGIWVVIMSLTFRAKVLGGHVMMINEQNFTIVFAV